MDSGIAYTDKQTKVLEKHIRSIYTEAKKDINGKLKDFNARFKVKDAKHKADLKAGLITKEDYQSWLKGQVFQGDHWKQMRTQMESILTHANEEAINIVNGGKISVIANNANYMAYTLEHGAGVNFGFALYDRSTVTNLLKEQPDLLPNKHIDPVKDGAWNRKKITRQVTLGILEGESTDQVADRLANVLSSQDQNAMLTTARTAMTSAQNAGRQLRMEEAVKKGIKLHKEWMCTLDLHTRTAHRELDGQKVPVDKPFKVDGYEIRFPADPQAEAYLVYNCRCTMVADLDDYPSVYQRYDNIDGVPVNQMTYQEWAKAKGLIKTDVGEIVKVNPYTWTLGNGSIEILGKTFSEKEIMSYVGTDDEDILYDILTNKYDSEVIDTLLDADGNFDVEKLRKFLGFDLSTPFTEPEKFAEKLDKYIVKITDTMEKKDAERFLELLHDCPNDDMKVLYKLYVDEIKGVKRSRNGGVFRPALNTVEYSYRTGYDDLNDFETLAHEFGHFFDRCVGKDVSLSYNEMTNVKGVLSTGRRAFEDNRAAWSDEFLSAIRQDKESLTTLMKSKSQDYNDFVADVWKSNASAGFQDAMDGFFGTRADGTFRWGHGEKYYNRRYNQYVEPYERENLKMVYQDLGFNASSQAKCKQIMRDYDTASEAWANISSALVCNDDSLRYFEQYMPNSLAAYKEIIKGVK